LPHAETVGGVRSRRESPGSSIMPSQKAKTHKGVKKRFKVSATGKVSHKPCGSSHLNSHKSGKKIRRLRRKRYLKTEAVSARLRLALLRRKPGVPELAEAEAAPSETATAQPNI
jgi:large subunit ribosomal protein L35